MSPVIARGFDADVDCTAIAVPAFRKGVRFIARYLAPHDAALTVAESQAISDAGIYNISICEHAAEQALGGSSVGTADGRTAANAARDLGQPIGSAIFATADYDVLVGQTTLPLAYLKSFAASVRAWGFKVGIYGNGNICQAALDAGLVDYTWLAGGMGMTGSQTFAASGKATIIQDVGDKAGFDLGIDIDSDSAYITDFGGWKLPAKAPSATGYVPAASTLQTMLNNAGANPQLVVDNNWGPLSSQALIDYYHRQPS
jgi:hypothetical protein